MAFIPGVILRACFGFDAYTFESYLVYGILCYLCTISILFFLIQRDVYENRKFSFVTVVLPAILVCMIRWLIWYLSDGQAAFWVTGGATFFSPILFPDISFQVINKESVLYDLIATILCDLLITIPAFIGAGLFGYRRRKREIEEMIEKHEEKIR